MKQYRLLVGMAVAMVVLGTTGQALAQGVMGVGPGRPIIDWAWNEAGFPTGISSIGRWGGFRPSMHAGWLEHRRGIDMADDLPNILGGVTNLRPRRLSGVWLEASLSARPTRDLEVSVTGATLVAQKSSGTILSNIGLTARFEMDEEQWSYLDLTASHAMGSSSRVVAGFRWDHTSSRLHITRPRESYDDFIVNLYVPLLGIEVANKGFLSASRFRIMGFPFVPGDITFHTWEVLRASSSQSHQTFTGGYYVEVLTEYRQRIGRSGSMGVFARWDLLHAATATEAALNPGRQSIRWYFDRSSWTLGAVATIELNLL